MSTTIVVMTKEPVPGHVKTRLIPDIGADGATAIHEAMARETVQRARQSGLTVCVSLDGDPNSFFARDLRSLGVSVEPQAKGDLGLRLSSAVRPTGKTLFLGTDCVLFEPSWLQQAANAGEAVSIGPADDGGYWLIGMDMAQPGLRQLLFEDIAWSTDAVCDETVARLQRQQHPIHWLPKQYDIDTFKDLERLKHESSCPHPIRRAIDAIALTGH